MPKENLTSEAIELIWTERERQAYHAGFAKYTSGQWADAAICMTMIRDGRNQGTAAKFWPFARDIEPPDKPIQALIAAAALLVAEIERLMRIEAQAEALAEEGARA